MSHRTQITLTDEQYDRLRDESRRSGLGLAELVRRAVDRSYGSLPRSEQLAAMQSAFGSWSGDGDREDDGILYVERLRRGLARRLADA